MPKLSSYSDEELQQLVDNFPVALKITTKNYDDGITFVDLMKEHDIGFSDCRKKLQIPYENFWDFFDHLYENVSDFNCGLIDEQYLISTSYNNSLAWLFDDINYELPTSFFDGIEDWDVSKVECFDYMFNSCINFNSDIGKWNVSNAKSMKNMFTDCRKFNQNLNDWNVNNVINMEGMFSDCFDFNKPLNKWNTGKVINMFRMFEGCYQFNQKINNWDVGNVTDMSFMFCSCQHYNQPLDKWKPMKVESTFTMFEDCTSLNQDFSAWWGNNIKNFNSMFAHCKNFDWDVSYLVWDFAIDISSMFAQCRKFTGKGVETWDTHSVSNFSKLFYVCNKFNWDVSNFTFRNVKSTQNMFPDIQLRSELNFSSYQSSGKYVDSTIFGNIFATGTNYNYFFWWELLMYRGIDMAKYKSFNVPIDYNRKGKQYIWLQNTISHYNYEKSDKCTFLDRHIIRTTGYRDFNIEKYKLWNSLIIEKYKHWDYTKVDDNIDGDIRLRNQIRTVFSEWYKWLKTQRLFTLWWNEEKAFSIFETNTTFETKVMFLNNQN